MDRKAAFIARHVACTAASSPDNGFNGHASFGENLFFPDGGLNGFRTVAADFPHKSLGNHSRE